MNPMLKPISDLIVPRVAGLSLDPRDLDLDALADLEPKSLSSTKPGGITFATSIDKVAALRACAPEFAFVPLAWPTEDHVGTIFRTENPKLWFVRTLRLRLEKCGDSGPSIHKGANVSIDPTAAVGGRGFGYVRTEDGSLLHFPHIGGVSLMDDVEIFPFANVDRGALSNTEIGAGTKVDHYVHVAHNVVVGAHTMLAAKAVLCGSSKVGNHCFVGVGALIKNGVTVGNRCTVGMGAVVIRDVPDGATVVGNPARMI
jgi:acetyltransferase-like isoleucine patch superfamily enzyme